MLVPQYNTYTKNFRVRTRNCVSLRKIQHIHWKCKQILKMVCVHVSNINTFPCLFGWQYSALRGFTLCTFKAPTKALSWAPKTFQYQSPLPFLADTSFLFMLKSLLTNLLPFLPSHICYRQFVAHLPSEHTNCSFPHFASFECATVTLNSFKILIHFLHLLKCHIGYLKAGYLHLQFLPLPL